MERIISLNAVDTSSAGGNSGMKPNYLAPKKESIDGNAVSIAAVTVLETPTDDQHTRWMGELLRWRERVRDRINSMHKSEEQSFPIELVKNLFSVVQNSRIAFIYILG